MAEDPFRPSEYTSALLRQLRLRGPCTGRVLELGTGSGVVLAALAADGAREAVGVDLEPEAVARTQALLQDHGVLRASVRQGHLWEPLAGERFDLIAFNPPQFPAVESMDDGRLATWSHGGSDGRRVVDPFLDGLAEHLMPGGLAVMTHNDFIGLDATAARLQRHGLSLAVAQTVSVPIPPYKLQALPPQLLQRHLGRSLHCVGPYAFAEFHVLEIRHGRPTAGT